MNKINEVKEPNTEINEKPNLISRFAEINNISIEEAQLLIGAENEEEILNKIKNYTLSKIKQNAPVMNRAQRRVLAKKTKNKEIPKDFQEVIAETTQKLSYINLIQKLKELNKKKENENYEEITEKN